MLPVDSKLSLCGVLPHMTTQLGSREKFQERSPEGQETEWKYAASRDMSLACLSSKRSWREPVKAEERFPFGKAIEKDSCEDIGVEEASELSKLNVSKSV